MNKTHSTREERERLEIEARAAEWFGRCELGLSAEEERRLMAWLELDPRHGEAMREMDSTWELLDRLQESPRFNPRRRPTWWRTLAAPALAAAGIAAACFFFAARPATVVPHVETETITASAEIKQVELPDGSRVRLKANSTVVVAFSPQERRIHLTAGEAHFAVSKDPKRPFVVHVGGVAVRAVGTAFNVRFSPDAVTVLVTEGIVGIREGREIAPADISHTAAVTAASATEGDTPDWRVPAGQQAMVRRTTNASPVETTPSPKLSVEVNPLSEQSIREELAWQDLILRFDNEPLADVVAKFNRYNSHQLVIDDSTLARRPFGGTLRADNYLGLIDLLQKRFDVEIDHEPNRTILRARRP